MRKITKAVGLVALLVGARYAPLGWPAQPVSSAAPPQVITGSVEKPAAAPAARNSLDDSVRTILAQANSEAGSGQNGQKAPTPARGRSNRDDNYADGIYTGGTGLLEEIEPEPPKSHALAAANPDDYLVICEAGCRSANDRIVYRVSKIAAATTAIVQRRLELSSATPQASEDTTEGVVCVAGCYDDDPKPSKRHAQSSDSARVQTAATHKPASEPDAPKAAVKLAEMHVLEAKPLQTASIPEPEKVEAKSQQNSAPAQPATVPDKAAAAAPVADPALPAEVAVIETAQVHLISAETEAHLARKRTHLASAPSAASVPVAQSGKFAGRLPAPAADGSAVVSGWRTRGSSIVALPREDQKKRSIVALNPKPIMTAGTFETSIWVESGWEGSVANTQ